MRAQGRCAGCHAQDELKAAEWHVLCCEKWAALYRSDPAAALSPAEEYDRWRREDRSGERAADLQRRVVDTQAERAASVARFASVDPLGDL